MHPQNPVLLIAQLKPDSAQQQYYLDGGPEPPPRYFEVLAQVLDLGRCLHYLEVGVVQQEV